jgi:hypothetical protein
MKNCMDIGGYPQIVLFNFLQCVIPTMDFQICEAVYGNRCLKSIQFWLMICVCACVCKIQRQQNDGSIKEYLDFGLIAITNEPLEVCT